MKVKDTFFLLILPLFISNYANAKTSIGLKAGLNTSTIDNLMYESLTSFNAGLPVEFRFSKKFALQPEINFVTKGGKTIIRQYYNGLYYDSESAFKINYIEIPLYTKFSFGSEHVKLDLLTGPSIAFALKGERSNRRIYNGIIESDYKSINFENDSVSKTDFAFNIGAGITFSSGPRNIFFNIIYQEGMTDILTASKEYENDNEAYNRSFSFCLGIFTPLYSKKTKADK